VNNADTAPSANLSQSSVTSMSPDKLAAPMFLLTLVFLAILAGLIVCLVDIPRVAELAAVETTESVDAVSTSELAGHSSNQNTLQAGAKNFSFWLFFALMLIWPIYWIEYFWLSRSERQITTTKNNAAQSELMRPLACLVPPLRLGSVIPSKGNRLWLPILGWQMPGKVFLERLEKKAARPMLLVAFMILPVLLLEYAFSSLVQAKPWLQMTLHTATGFIWWSFTIEFIIMVSATDRKFNYIKKNWIDLVIIVLPLVSFLRTIRVLRLARLARIQQVSKVTRVYRMRGLIAKVMRGLMLMELINRLLRIKPEKTLAKLYETKADKEEELAALQLKIDALEEQVKLGS